MTSLLMAEEELPGVQGLVLFGFPLHRAGQPSTERADHLPGIAGPLLFVSGSRDAMAKPGLLDGVVGKLQNGRLRRLDKADHGYKVSKRAREGRDVFSEAAVHVSDWLAALEL
jgi:predicted alpha/beta-hydrolase family hydrolase